MLMGQLETFEDNLINESEQRRPWDRARYGNDGRPTQLSQYESYVGASTRLEAEAGRLAVREKARGQA